MNIALVDDREADRVLFEKLLREYDAIHQIGMTYFHFASGEALLKEYWPFRFAIVILDIYMDNMTGIETARKIRETDDDVILIFLTTSEEHRSAAFSVFASAYLSKPCSGEEVFRTLDHIFRLRTENCAHFSFSYDRRDYSLPFCDIVSLETDRNYLSIVEKNGTVYRTRMTFSAAEQQLDGRFLTLMKGIIVNLDFVTQFTDDSCVMQGGAAFPLHVKSKKELQQKWLNYKFAKIRKNAEALESVSHD